MKIGTVPKISIGVMVVIVLVFIGSRQLLSPDEDSAPSAKALAPHDEKSTPSGAKVNAAREEKVAGAPLETEPEFSAEEMEQIEDFFAQLDADDVHSEEPLPENADERGKIDSEMFDTDDEQSPEDLMNAYVEAYRNVNFQAMLPLVTGSAREEIESSLRFLNGEIPDEIENGMVDYLQDAMKNEEMINEALAMYREIIQGSEIRAGMQEMLGRAAIVSSGYVGNEFHFKLRTPIPEMPELPDMSELSGMLEIELPDMPEIPENIDKVHKMRKQDGEWLIYE